MNRRERTRNLIELGGLVAKAGLVDLTGDDRAALYGAMLEVADVLRDSDGERILQLWRRRGRRMFEAAQVTVREPPLAPATLKNERSAGATP